MTSTARKTLTGSLAALTLGLSVLATSTAPAAAKGWRGGGWHGHHRHWGGGVALGLGALAVGAALATAAPVYYGTCTIVRRPVVNRFGDVVGVRRVRVCD